MVGPGRVRRSPVPAIVVGVVGLLAVGFGQSVPNRHAMERDLTERSERALQAAGISRAQVSFVGRDGVVRVARAADADRAIAVVRAQEGVRVADVVVPPDVPGNTTRDAAAQAASQVMDDRTVAEHAPEVQRRLVDLPRITFLTGNATLTPEGQVAVAEAATVLKETPALRVRVEGHTDSIGSDESNLVLSRARVQTVVAMLQMMGVDGGRLTPDGFGESRPKVPDDSPEHQAVNRRVEFIVQP